MEEYVLQLNLPVVFPQYFLPNVETVVGKLLTSFQLEESDLMVIPLRGNGKGIYRIHLNYEEDMETCCECELTFDVQGFGQRTV